MPVDGRFDVPVLAQLLRCSSAQGDSAGEHFHAIPLPSLKELESADNLCQIVLNTDVKLPDYETGLHDT